MSQQLSFFPATERAYVDDERGAIRYVPAMLASTEASKLFALLLEGAPWSNETMWMYDRMVDVPRLVARFRPAEGGVPPELGVAQSRAETLLRVRFNSIGLNYYRDGADSVAWHNDRVDELVPEPTIALLSLGSVRKMQVRSKARPRTSFAIELEPGSLLVMSGRSQEFWEHAIPKSSAAVGPRISAAFRTRLDAR